VAEENPGPYSHDVYDVLSVVAVGTVELMGGLRTPRVVPDLIASSHGCECFAG